MTRIIKFVLVILIFVFSSTVLYAFQNEPNGFRGINWGSTDKVGGKGYKLRKDKGKSKSYSRNYEDRVFYRDGIEVRALYIIYYTFEDKFMQTKILCKPSDWNSMKKILISLYGSPTKATEKVDYKTAGWHGQTTNINMLFMKKKGSKKEYFTVDLMSKRLYKEYHAWYNAQKRAKKSKTGGF